MDLHMGKLIAQQMPPEMTKAKLSRLLGVTQSTTAKMLKSKSVQTRKLALVSERLNYNFFRVIGEMVEIGEPSFAEALEGKDLRIEELAAEVERLKEENRYLKKAIDLMGDRKG